MLKKTKKPTKKDIKNAMELATECGELSRNTVKAVSEMLFLTSPGEEMLPALHATVGVRLLCLAVLNEKDAEVFKMLEFALGDLVRICAKRGIVFDFQTMRRTK